MKRTLFINISEGNVPEVFVQWTRSNIDRCQDWPWSGWWCWLLSRESVINSLLRIPIVTRAWRIGESYFHRDATYQPRPRVRFLISPMMRVPCQRKVKAEDMMYDVWWQQWDLRPAPFWEEEPSQDETCGIAIHCRLTIFIWTIWKSCFSLVMYLPSYVFSGIKRGGSQNCTVCKISE